MFPLVSAEAGADFNLEKVLRYGALPTTFIVDSAEDYLQSYSYNYLTQEIEAEAQIRHLGGFSRFLEVAARQNAQVTNASSIARNAGVARTTVQSYFRILEDTLLGFWLPAWKLKRANKQVMAKQILLL